MHKEQITLEDGRYLIYYTFPEMPSEREQPEMPASSQQPQHVAPGGESATKGSERV